MNSLINELNRSENIDKSIELEETSVNTLFESIDLSDICYLCVHYSDGKCGAALYHSNSHSFQVIKELEDNDLDSLEGLLMQTEPNHVIISSKSDPKLIELLKRCAKRKTQESDDIQITDLRSESKEIHENSSSASDLLWKMEFHFDVHILTYTQFGFESAKNRILSINTINGSLLSEETQKIVFFSTFFDFSNNNTFKSFGALLRYLDMSGADINQTNVLSSDNSTISRLYFNRLVTIERNSYESLQIFQKEWHPSAAKQGLNQKEGLSLFGLFNCCVSKIGANYLRKLFLLPTQETDIIMDRLLAIEFFMQPNHKVLRDNLNHHLRQIKSVTALFNRFLSSYTLTISDFQILNNNLLNALRIREIIAKQTTHLKIFKQIKEKFSEELDRVVNTFVIIDFEKSIRSQSFEINAGIDPELDDTKYLFTHLPQVLEEVAQNEANTFGPILSDCNCVYIPQIGFLTSARIVDDSTPPHQIDEELKFLVKVGDRYYYKTFNTLELDRKFGDIQSEIIDRQIQIINQFQELIFKKKYLFVSIEKCCATLDALIAMSRTALTYNYNKPNLTTDGNIEIIDGRHPLVELMSNSFVPNDFFSGGQQKKAKLITGPNACGKSVYLKQISLIVYLAHIGSYVPALRANIPIVDRIFSRIHTPESISLRLSTFMLDLKQMSNATKNATKRSLVVIDEFGKGTQPIDGLALMAASIQHWLTVSSPHLIVSSHFRCLPTIINRNEFIDCQTFEFNKTVNGLKYSFKLKAGHFKDSMASQIAYMADIPNHIINRGLEICELMANNKTIDCSESEEMILKRKAYEGTTKMFLQINIKSEEEIKNFFNLNFGEHSVSEE